MVLNAHCNYLSVFIKGGKKNMFVLLHRNMSIGSFDWKSVFLFFFNPTVGLIQFWESCQMFDLHHPNKAQLNFTQQNWQTVGQQILENLAFKYNTNMSMERQKTHMFLMSFNSQSENGSALIQWAAGGKLSSISWVFFSSHTRKNCATWHRYDKTKATL